MRPYIRVARCVKIDDTIMSREMPTKRKYELKKRAEEMAETHLRITEAAIELHGTRRAVPHDDERGRRAGGRGAPHPLPPLSHRGRPLRGVLEPLLRRQPVARSRQLARDSRPAAAARARPRRALRLLRAHRADAQQRAARRRARRLRPRRRGPAARVPRGGRRGPHRRPPAPRSTASSSSAERCATPSPSRPGARSSANGVGRSDAAKLVTALVEGAATVSRGSSGRSG